MVKLLVIIAAVAFAHGSWAATVIFEWQSISENSTLPGLNNGDPITINVFADNGGSSLLSQTWNNADISFATLTAGSYQATYFPPTNFGDPVFETDAAGNASSSRLVFAGPLNPSNFDTQGGSAQVPFLARNIAGTSLANTIAWEFPAGDTFDETNWTVSAVPVPAAVWLFGSGLAGLAGMARRKNAA